MAAGVEATKELMKFIREALMLEQSDQANVVVKHGLVHFPIRSTVDFMTSFVGMELPSWIFSPQPEFACFLGRRHWGGEQTKTENTRRKKRRRRRADRTPGGAGRGGV